MGYSIFPFITAYHKILYVHHLVWFFFLPCAIIRLFSVHNLGIRLYEMGVAHLTRVYTRHLMWLASISNRLRLDSSSNNNSTHWDICNECKCTLPFWPNEYIRFISLQCSLHPVSMCGVLFGLPIRRYHFYPPHTHTQSISYCRSIDLFEIFAQSLILWKLIISCNVHCFIRCAITVQYMCTQGVSVC